MRKDMSKVLVERPRRGARWKTRRKRLAGANDLPSAVGVRRYVTLTGTESKCLNEHLGPLRRFLWRQRGRRWDNVHGDIRKVMDTRNEVQAHILSHIDDFVAVKVHIDRRGNWHFLRYGRLQPLEGRVPNLYVDPRDGIVKETRKLLRKIGIQTDRDGDGNGKVDPNRVSIDGTTELRRIDGIWYRFNLGERRTSRPMDAPERWLAFPARRLQWKYPYKDRLPCWRRIESKRQLSKRELQQHGLTNEVPL